MQVLNVLHEARWKYMTQNDAKESPSAHHRTALSSVGSVTARHSIWGGRQPDFAACTRNGITELLQRAPPIFGWAAIFFVWFRAAD